LVTQAGKVVLELINKNNSYLENGCLLIRSRHNQAKVFDTSIYIITTIFVSTLSHQLYLSNHSSTTKSATKIHKLTIAAELFSKQSNMALTRQGSTQVAAVLNAMKASKRHDVSAILAQIDQLSANHRRYLFATTGNDSMLQLALQEPRGLYLAYMLEQHANDPSLPLDVDFILRYRRNHRFISSLCG
jgi:hypothetical protein